MNQGHLRNPHLGWLRSARGFTLIELLVVILIVAVLVAIAAPSFLGQTQKAHDSASQQYLVVAYRAATAWAVDHNGDPAFASYAQGDYATPAGVAAAINASDPELQAFVALHPCPSVADLIPTHIYVDVASGGDLVLCNDPNHTVWTLRVINHTLQPFGPPQPPIAEGVYAPAGGTPTVSGTAEVGFTLTADPNPVSWSNSPTSYSYQWQNSSLGTSWSNVTSGSGTASTYVATSADQGLLLDVVVTAHNAGGSASVASPATTAVLTAAPSGGAPTVSGTAEVGFTLTADPNPGSWTPPATSYSYQWQNSNLGTSWNNVTSGGTSSTYVATSADQGLLLDVVVTAHNAGGTTAVASPATTAVLTAAPSGGAPTISGTAEVGFTLTADPGSWTPPATSYSYQWQNSSLGTTWSNVAASGTASTYVATTADQGLLLDVVVTAHNAGGTTAVASPATTAVLPAAPVIQTAPLISNSDHTMPTAQVGDHLSVSTGAWSDCAGSPPCTYTYTWQWSSNGSSFTPIAGATASAYIVKTTDVGLYLQASVQAHNAGGNATGAVSSSNYSDKVPAFNTTPPSFTGNVQVGQTLTASVGAWTGASNLYSYTWESSSDQISWGSASGSNTSSTYVVQAGDLGKYLLVSVQAQNAGGSLAVSSSPSVAAVVPLAPVNSGPPTIADASTLSQIQVGDHLTANPGTWSDCSSCIYAYTWQYNNGTSWVADTNPSSSTTYTVGSGFDLSGDLNRQLRVSVQATNSGGSGAATSNATVAVRDLPGASFTATPANPSNVASPSFSFNATSTPATFQCSLDGASFTVCTSPTAVTPGDGAHTFYVKAVAQNGSVGPATSYGWTIDTVAPVVTLTAPANGATVTSSLTPTFSGAAGNVSGDLATVTVNVYSGSSATGTPVQTLTTTRSGASYSVVASPALTNGTYTAQATQMDSAGNTGSSAANTFTLANILVTYLAAVNASAPTAHWQLDGSANPLVESVSGFNATASGASFAAPGFVSGSGALDINTVGGAATVANNAAFDRAGTSPFTIEAWVYPRTISTLADRVFERATADTSPNFQLVLRSDSGTRCQRWQGSVGDTAAGPVLSLNQWNYVVCTYDGSNLRVYVNGVLSAGPAGTTNPTASSQSLPTGGSTTIGSAPPGGGGASLDGRLDELAYYQHALSASDIAAHWAAAH